MCKPLVKRIALLILEDYYQDLIPTPFCIINILVHIMKASVRFSIRAVFNTRITPLKESDTIKCQRQLHFSLARVFAVVAEAVEQRAPVALGQALVDTGGVGQAYKVQEKFPGLGRLDEALRHVYFVRDVLQAEVDAVATEDRQDVVAVPLLVLGGEFLDVWKGGFVILKGLQEIVSILLGENKK